MNSPLHVFMPGVIQEIHHPLHKGRVNRSLRVLGTRPDPSQTRPPWNHISCSAIFAINRAPEHRRVTAIRSATGAPASMVRSSSGSAARPETVLAVR